MDPTERFLLEGFDRDLALHWIIWATFVNRVVFPLVRARRVKLVKDSRQVTYYVPAPLQNVAVLLLTILAAAITAAATGKFFPHELVAGMAAICFSSVVHGAFKSRRSSPPEEPS